MITPPAMLGVMGGGQLGRYFVLAARDMGYRTTVLEPDPESPAGKVADAHIVAPYDDPAALDQLATTCAVVTTEFENAPARSLSQLVGRTLVRPAPAAIAVTQDRIEEKRFLGELGVNLVPYVVVDTPESLADAIARFTFPSILKTATLGYDGKGQVRCTSAEELTDAWHELGRVACVLEQQMPLERELSVVLARSSTGEIAYYPVSENVHVDGILDTSLTPAVLPGDGHRQAGDLCAAIADTLGFVGVMAVEMFVVGSDVLVNELAPRPHNTGHYTLDACVTDQFQQQVRAICGLALGDTALVVPGVAMVNLLGDLWQQGEPRWDHALYEPRAQLHLYGKVAARPGRKMGHLTVTGYDAESSLETALQLRRQLARAKT
jgi:5-(carboxyamino)imidazole ribonucleotide synthase